MQHRALIDRAMRDLPSAKAWFVARLVDRLDQRADLDDRRHLLYPVIAAAAARMEPMLEPEEVAIIAVAFLADQADGIARTLYAPAFLTDPMASMVPHADRLLARLAEAILDRLASGRIEAPERRLWRFHSDGADAAFPFGDEAEEDGDGPAPGSGFK